MEVALSAIRTRRDEGEVRWQHVAVRRETGGEHQRVQAERERQHFAVTGRMVVDSCQIQHLGRRRQSVKEQSTLTQILTAC